MLNYQRVTVRPWQSDRGWKIRQTSKNWGDFQGWTVNLPGRFMVAWYNWPGCGHLEDAEYVAFLLVPQKNLGRVPRPTHPIFLLGSMDWFRENLHRKPWENLTIKSPGCVPWEPKPLDQSRGNWPIFRAFWSDFFRRPASWLCHVRGGLEISHFDQTYPMQTISFWKECWSHIDIDVRYQLGKKGMNKIETKVSSAIFNPWFQSFYGLMQNLTPQSPIAGSFWFFLSSYQCPARAGTEISKQWNGYRNQWPIGKSLRCRNHEFPNEWRFLKGKSSINGWLSMTIGIYIGIVEVVRCINKWANGRWDDNKVTESMHSSLNEAMNQGFNESMNQWINESTNQQINELVNHRINEPLIQQLSQWNGESTNQWINGSVLQRLKESINQWINETVTQWINDWTIQWANESTNEWTSESLNQSSNESMSQWFEGSMDQ